MESNMAREAVYEVQMIVASRRRKGLQRQRAQVQQQTGGPQAVRKGCSF